MEEAYFKSGLYNSLPLNMKNAYVANFYLSNDLIQFKLLINVDNNKNIIKCDDDNPNLYAIFYLKAHRFEILDLLLVDLVYEEDANIVSAYSNNGTYYFEFENSYVDNSFIKFKANYIELQYLSTMEVDDDWYVCDEYTMELEEYSIDSDED